MRRTALKLLPALAIAVVYGLAAKLGLLLAFVGDNVSSLWPASAVAVFALVRLGPAYAPAVAVSAMVVTASTGAPIAAAALVGIGNAAEAWLAARLLHRVGFRRSLRRIRDVAALSAVATVVPCTVAATVGVGSLFQFGVIDRPAVAQAWLLWWLGDALGVAVVAPFLFACTSARNLGRWRARPVVELLVVLAALLAVALWSTRSDLPFVWTVFPLLILAAVRFGPAGGTAASLLVALVAVWVTSRHQGPFARWDVHSNLAVLQAFLFVVTFTATFIAASFAQMTEAEAERARLQAIEAAAHEREMIRNQLLGVLGHDLRNPLASIMAGVELLLRDDRGIDRVRVGRNIRNSAQRMTRLVDDLLGFTRSRLGAGIPIEPTETDLAALSRQAVLELQAVHPQRVLTVSNDVRAVGKWDPDRLLQLVSNLVGNAIEHSTSDVTVTVTAPRSGYVALEVANGGDPIAPALLGTLFEPFARGTRQGKGVGLGLFIVREIARAHGGTVEVKSSPHEGTRFTVELPVQQP